MSAWAFGAWAAAIACDVSPLALLALRSAPALSSAPTHASKPYDAATISAVSPFPLRASTGAFASIRGLIISTWQPCAAKWSAVFFSFESA